MIKIRFKNISKYGAVLVLLVFLHYVGILGPVESLVQRISSPLMYQIYGVGSFFRSRYYEQNDIAGLSNKNRILEAQVRALTAGQAEMIKYKEENERLRGMISFFDENKGKYLPSNVISRSDHLGTANDDQSIIIDKGSDDGLKDGLAVLDHEGNVVGKISDTKEKISRVDLLTSSRCKLAVSVVNAERTIGVAKGELGLTTRIDFIPQTEILHKEDLVLTSGLEIDIPRGLSVGRIDQVNKESNELWQDAYIRPISNLNDLSIVSVILPR